MHVFEGGRLYIFHVNNVLMVCVCMHVYVLRKNKKRDVFVCVCLLMAHVGMVLMLLIVLMVPMVLMVLMVLMVCMHACICVNKKKREGWHTMTRQKLSIKYGDSLMVSLVVYWIVGIHPWGQHSLRLGCGGGNRNSAQPSNLYQKFVVQIAWLSRVYNPPPHPILKECCPQGVDSTTIFLVLMVFI
jgi:hypothetical protein